MGRLFDLNTKHGVIFQNISNILMNLPSMVFFFCFGIFLANLSDRQIPATLYEGKILTQNIHAGGSAVFSFKVDRSRICEVNYSELIEDSSGVRYPLVDFPVFKAKRAILQGDTVLIGIDLPKGIKPGPAIYESERQYICNFTHRWISPLTVDNPDISFNVEK